jgi:hypothetical protein
MSERGSGTRNRIHKTPLNGQLFCGRCGSRLLLARGKGNGGIYMYFFCSSRQTGKDTKSY